MHRAKLVSKKGVEAYDGFVAQKKRFWRSEQK